MAEFDHLNDPWLVAVWPGMGSVAMLAGSHLARSLRAGTAGELRAEGLFEVQHVEVSDGVATAARPPRNLFLLWRDPNGRRDLILFVGETQPDRGGHALCERLAEQAKEWGVRRVVTFAAMATQLHPGKRPRVFAIGTDARLRDEAVAIDNVAPLRGGQISGLNGVMLAAAAEAGIDGLCLMGEMPFFAVQVPNPQASLAALEVFAALSGIDIDLTDLEQQADQVTGQLEQLYERLTGESADESDLGFTIPDVALPTEDDDEDEEADEDEDDGDGDFDADDTRDDDADEVTLTPRQLHRIESLFSQAEDDRQKAMDLKQELDRLGVFDAFEDRFLDLFRKGG